MSNASAPLALYTLARSDEGEFSMSQPEYFLVPQSVDWLALARQKQWLLRQEGASEEAAGLIQLLDAIQDAAVDRLGLPETTVFPKL